jgi:hypothetical protein
MVRKGSGVRVPKRALQKLRSGGVFVFLGSVALGDMSPTRLEIGVGFRYKGICTLQLDMSFASSVRGPIWYAKYRLPDVRQVQKKIGPAWTGRGHPAAGYVTKRLAEDWLRERLEEARRGTLPGLVRTGATFADAAAELLRTSSTTGCVNHRRSRPIDRCCARRSCRRSPINRSRRSRRR